MTNNYCDICGWKTPSYSVNTRIKKRSVKIGYMCGLCGKIHTMFPVLFLLSEDALKVKENILEIDNYRPKKVSHFSVSEQND